MGQLTLSVVMAVCDRDSPLDLREAINSIFNQTCLPRELIVTCDGPVSPEIMEVLDSYSSSPECDYVVLHNECKLGPAAAWNKGVEYATSIYIARMDSDDISLPVRLEKQANYLMAHPEIDVLGGYISEFSSDQHLTPRVRKVPLVHEHIERLSHSRNPLNHVTVVMKKAAMVSVGGYYQINGFVDYLLWCKMLKQGCRFKNLAEVLVNVRVDNGILARRSGIAYARSELRFFHTLYNIGHINLLELIRNILLRVPFRLLPAPLLGLAYSLSRRISF